MSSHGEWESYVHYSSEDATAVMPDNNCKKVTWFEQDAKSNETLQVELPMIVGTNTPLLLGHQNGHYTDFFQVLTVTMTEMPNDIIPSYPSYEKEMGVENKLLKRDTSSSPPPKMCVFYIGAKGPGQPVLYVHGFHDANCTLTTPGVGFECNLLAQ